MLNRVAAIRIVGLLLAFVLTIGDWPQIAGGDEVRTDQTHRHGSAPMVIGEGGGTCDHARIARGLCSIHPITSIDCPAITLASYVLQAELHPLLRRCKLYELNAVLRI